MDTLLILSDENRRYLSGYTGEDGSFNESAGALIITLDRLILATDSRYDTQAELETDGYEVVCYKKGLAKFLPETLNVLESKTVGMEFSRITHDHFEKIRQEMIKAEQTADFVPADKFLENFRIIKDDLEVEKIRAALKIAEKSFMALRDEIREGMTEKEAAWLLEKFMREAGADTLSFPVIAASGPNSAMAHAVPCDRAFQKGEPLLFDFGAKLNGYCSDTTRTLIMGEPDARFREVRDILFKAQAMAVHAIKPGIRACEVDKIARDHIDATRYKETFGHSLGHGVGLAIHETPRLSKTSEDILEAGMIVTVEPGIYLPQWGGMRLENMILVTREGAQVLNTMEYDDYIL